MKPNEIGYMSEISKPFAEALNMVVEPHDFIDFLEEWRWILDDESKKLTGDDWLWLRSLVADCRKESFAPEKKHKPAMALLIPEILMRISIIANNFKAPEGCAFIRCKEKGMIDDNFKWRKTEK